MAHADPDSDSATLALSLPTDEQPPALSDELADLARESDIDAEHGIAANTRRAYAADWRVFTTFCTKHGLRALPATPQTVALYYAALKKAGKKYATIDRARAGIRHVHRQHGYTSPTDDPETGLRLRGIAKQITKKSTQKAPLLDDLLRRVVQAIDPTTLVGKRDHALLVLGWCTAMRRSAICNINVDHVRWTYDDDGVEILELFVPSSKTDQLGLGKTKRIPHFDDPDIEPIAAVRAWLAAIGNPTDGPLFLPLTPDGKGVIARRLNDKTVARIVKKYAELLGFAGDFAGHSLKRGVLSTGARAAFDERPDENRRPCDAPTAVLRRCGARRRSTDNANCAAQEQRECECSLTNARGCFCSALTRCFIATRNERGRSEADRMGVSGAVCVSAAKRSARDLVRASASMLGMVTHPAEK